MEPVGRNTSGVAGDRHPAGDSTTSRTLPGRDRCAGRLVWQSIAGRLACCRRHGRRGRQGAVGDTPSVQLPWQSHCGQTHSTVHLRTGTSLTQGIFTRCFTSWRRHRQPPWQPSWPPSLPVSPQPAPWPEPSQLPHLSQQRVTPGTQMQSHLHVYLYVVTFLVVQVMWHTGTSLQPQCGQQLQHDSQPALPQHAASSASAAVAGCPKKETHSTARRVRRFLRNTLSWLFSPMESFWITELGGQNEYCTRVPNALTAPGMLPAGKSYRLSQTHSVLTVRLVFIYQFKAMPKPSMMPPWTLVAPAPS